MKHRIYALLLCICFLLSGCNAESDGISETAEDPTTETSAETESPAAELTEETAETTSAPKETTKTEETAANNEPPSLDTLSLHALSRVTLDFPKKDGAADIKEYFYTNLYDSQLILLGDMGISYRDSSSVFFSHYCFAREAEQGIAVTDEEKKNLKNAVLSKPYRPFRELEKDSAYPLSPNMRSILELGKITRDQDEVTREQSEVTWRKASVKNLQCGYQIKESFTVNAFVSRTGEDKASLIIDPAYMIGIPVYGRNSAHMTFNLNGTEMIMDSFPITSLFPIDWDRLEETENDYFYAKVQMSDLSVHYDFRDGYSCEADVTEIEPITYDINEALLEPIFAGKEKNPVIAETYRVITESLDTIYKDSTRGITLLDLDFDGTPELLVSDVFERDTDNDWEKLAVNVSIYRIENGGLKYIDTFQNAYTVVYDVWNSLGLKTFPDGTKAWFSTSPDNEDFLYQLKGDQWIATEVFARKNPREVTSENGYTSTEYDYYFLGEKIEPTVLPASEDYVQFTDVFLEWKGIVSHLGWMGELIGFIRADYCSDIAETYSLFNDWLSKPITRRELFYRIAYMTDSFYLGDYNPASRTYDYWFLGAYAKPVIYLYPEEKTEVSVWVDFTEGGELTCTYPEYGEGWEVTALPDGTIYDKDGNEYYCLYWEGSGSAEFEYGKGWCVAGSDTAAFLREKLLGIGLTAREANEFIIYWLPELQKNPYNLITFHTDDYAKSVPLTVSPIPDTVIRVFMTYEPADTFTEIKPQTLPHYEREGFTLVEWGGSPSGEALLQ